MDRRWSDRLVQFSDGGGGIGGHKGQEAGGVSCAFLGVLRRIPALRWGRRYLEPDHSGIMADGRMGLESAPGMGGYATAALQRYLILASLGLVSATHHSQLQSLPLQVSHSPHLHRVSSTSICGGSHSVTESLRKFISRVLR